MSHGLPILNSVFSFLVGQSDIIAKAFHHPQKGFIFTRNFSVPFDNNQAERDLRMIKAKVKVSGCFRTEKGAQEYLDIMSYASTAKKLGSNAYEAIRNAVIGRPDYILILGC